MVFLDIENLSRENTNFRKVLFTGTKSQLVLMSLKKNEDIGEEVHATIDQILCVVSGKGEAIVGGMHDVVEKNSVIFVPAGTLHNIKNTGESDLKLYTIYSPPGHKDGTIHVTKEEAMKEEKY